MNFRRWPPRLSKYKKNKYRKTRSLFKYKGNYFMENVVQKEVILGVDNSEDWVLADNTRRRHISGLTTIEIDITWLVPAFFKLHEWVQENAKIYTFFNSGRVVIQEPEGIIKIVSSRGKIEVCHIGDPIWVNKWIKYFDKNFKRAESLIEWVYSTHGDEVSVPLNYRLAIKSAYPWLNKDLFEYIDDYLNSEACVLILIGPPGTGKCLDPEEEIELLVSDEIFEKMKNI